MKKFLLIGIFLAIIAWFAFLISHNNLQVLNPQGVIALQEKNLIIVAMTIMLAVAIPVILIAFFVGWKYQSKHQRSTYLPEWTGNNAIKISYWLFLGGLALVFFYIVWVSAHQLDPYKPIDSKTKPLTIQVVALQWKWLFIYPEQHIATVNFMQLPINTPINFTLTADGPMNSFWIPQLGGQIYAMTTMETKLHLMANHTGDFPGGAAEINGSGFAGMRFTTRVSSKNDFDAWVQKVKESSKPLDANVFNQLNQPSEDTPVTFYSSVDKDLYDTIIKKYMMPDKKQELRIKY